jgi:hypothetical protein
MWIALLFALVYLVIYVPVMLAEAETVRHLFSDDYESYARNVPMFVPRFTPYRPVRSGQTAGETRRSVDFALYLHHREYRAVLGYLVVVALLIGKMYLVR